MKFKNQKSIGMWNLTKNAYGIGALKKKKNIICFPLFNEDEQMNEVLDELPLHLHYLHPVFMNVHLQNHHYKESRERLRKLRFFMEIEIFQGN